MLAIMEPHVRHSRCLADGLPAVRQDVIGRVMPLVPTVRREHGMRGSANPSSAATARSSVSTFKQVAFNVGDRQAGGVF
jgi:hypothetical protein